MIAFVPTPSTKHLIELAKTCAINPLRILDLCCGSGWVAQELKRHWPEAQVWASDIRADEFVADPYIIWNDGDLFEGLSGEFDLIVCNPPYVPSAVCSEQELEPRIAFDGGKTGHELINRVFAEVDPYLADSGWLVIEIGSAIGFEIPTDADLIRMGHDAFLIYRKGNNGEH